MGTNPKKLKRIVMGLGAAIFAIPIVTILLVTGNYWVTLPSQLKMTEAEKLGEVYEIFQTTAPNLKLPKANQDYPSYMHCIFCAGEPKGKCTWRLSIQVAEKFQREGEHQKHLNFIFKSWLLAMTLRYKYNDIQLERLYLAVFSHHNDFSDIDAVCLNLFNKQCKALGVHEAFLLEGWIKYPKASFERLRDDPERFKSVFSVPLEVCK